MTRPPDRLDHRRPARARRAAVRRRAGRARRRRRPAPAAGWRLSPWAVATYLLGGDAARRHRDHAQVRRRPPADRDRRRHAGHRPGAAAARRARHRQDLGRREHLAAAISGDSTLLVQGTAGTAEEAIRYGWNYARLLAEGPSRAALVPSPVMRAMETGALARVEELTRIPADVQDALITILSEKTLPIPELDDEVQARRGFNVIATANNRDRGVNELSCALRRRFNTVVLPLPADRGGGGRDRRHAASPQLGRVAGAAGRAAGAATRSAGS